MRILPMEDYDDELCDHARRVLERLHYRDEKLSNEVKDLNAKLVVETTKYEMQSKVLKTHNQLLAFSWIFFIVFVAVSWGNYCSASNGGSLYKLLP
jgi:hypothetical protein